MSIKLYQSPTWLQRQYIDNNKSVEEMAVMANCAPNTIRAALKKYGLMMNND